MLDLGVEPVFVAEIAERLFVAPGAPEIVESAQITARRERPPARGGDEHARDGGIRLPVGELPRQRTHHAVRHRVERVRPVEGDQTRRAPALEKNFGVIRASRRHAIAHR